MTKVSYQFYAIEMILMNRLMGSFDFYSRYPLRASTYILPNLVIFEKVTKNMKIDHNSSHTEYQGLEPVLRNWDDLNKSFNG